MLPSLVHALEAGDDHDLAGGEVVRGSRLSSIDLMRALVNARSVRIGTCQPV